jgi:CAAX protease family protein
VGDQTTGRALSWPAYIGIVVVYIAIVQGVGLLLAVDTGDGESQFPTAEVAVREGLIPVGLSVLFGAGVVTWLGWWSPVLRDDRPVQPWVRRVPITMIVVALLATNYGHLADQTTQLVVSLISLTLCVGVGEELMFRGLGVVTFRRGGFAEGQVALYTSVIFGLVHVSNAIGHGPQALIQAAVVSTTGYFFYLARRSTGTILVPMLAHGLWDFSIVSTLCGPERAVYAGTALVIIAQVWIIVVLIRRRHRIELSAAAPAT